MGDARAYRCPGCGGQVDEQARECPYCRGPVATVRCANCFHMNVPEARHCSACGRDLGLEPIGTHGTLQCPRCERSLDVFASGPGVLLDCGHCGGQFVHHALLKELLERRQVYGDAAPRKPLPPARVEPVRYIPCPECGTLMARRNFGGTSGVIVDVCALHGIWFDLGELPRVMAFVESGGLIRAQQRRQEQERLSRPPQVSAFPPLTASTSALGPGPELLDDLGHVASALLSLVNSALRR